MEWIGAGLAFEGTLAGRPRLSTLADPAVPTCALTETVAQVRDRMGRWPLALAVAGPGRVVQGLVRAETLGPDDDAPVASVMEEGPSTYRPHVTAAEMSQNLEHKDAPWVVVTTLGGRLLGVAWPEVIHQAAKADEA
jgi:hypothetical protein